MKTFFKLASLAITFAFSQQLLANGSAISYIDSCSDIPYQLTGETLLVTGDISATSLDSDCIHIWAPNVTLDCQGHRITGTGWEAGFSGVKVESDNVQVQNCEFNNWTYGINFSGVGGEIGWNKVFDNDRGILVRLSQYVSVIGNTVHENEIGIYLFTSAHNEVVSNLIQHSGYVGIFLHDAYWNDILGNSVNRNGDGMSYQPEAGIMLQNGSQHNEVRDNTANLNEDYGILVSGEFTNYNEVFENTVNKNSGYGIRVRDDLIFYAGDNRCRKNSNGPSHPEFDSNGDPVCK